MVVFGLLVGLVTAVGQVSPAGAVEVPAVVEVSVTGWQLDSASGTVTYDVAVSGVGPCVGACTLGLSAGRDDGSGVTAVAALPVTETSRVLVGGQLRLGATAAGDKVVLPEVTHIRAAWYQGGTEVAASAWTMVSSPYSDPAVALAGGGGWTVDTNTGAVTYALTITGVGLAQAGGPCQGLQCRSAAEGGRMKGGQFLVVTQLTCAGEDTHTGAWTFTRSCSATPRCCRRSPTSGWSCTPPIRPAASPVYRSTSPGSTRRPGWRRLAEIGAQPSIGTVADSFGSGSWRFVPEQARQPPPDQHPDGQPRGRVLVGFCAGTGRGGTGRGAPILVTAPAGAALAGAFGVDSGTVTTDFTEAVTAPGASATRAENRRFRDPVSDFSGGVPKHTAALAQHAVLRWAS